METRFDNAIWKNYIKSFCKNGAVRLDKMYSANGDLFLLWKQMND